MSTEQLPFPKTIFGANEEYTPSDNQKPPSGRKFDSGKPQYGLLPPNALKAIVEILTFGAEKYEPNNWKRVPDAQRRYFDAAMRHLWAWKDGEQNDPESGKNHLAHAGACILFMLSRDLVDPEEWSEQ